MNDDQRHDALAEGYRKLAFEANELLRSAANGRGDAVVPAGQLNRLRRELKGERQTERRLDVCFLSALLWHPGRFESCRSIGKKRVLQVLGDSC